MRSFLKYTPAAGLLLVVGAVTPNALAQKWELGVLGGGSMYNSASVSNGSTNGSVGFRVGTRAVRSFFGQNGK